ncbi:hypothetical protein [Caulobacter sp. 17J65-9]|uniref:hypothetical protein n=1 Tax=Caulobacter sp. 17J65-9 TaxID=2709382 RepID=UPI0013CADD6D|nr:hypothetical protein [Caulobacter sp. 17J65-9]NEX91197.1 hypothetical protein [Caulobacter sp. 17J65-9]
MTTASEPVNAHLEAKLGPTHTLFRRMTLERFNALAQWSMPPAMRADTLLASAWTDADERVAIAVLHLTETREFMCVAFARDSAGRWRGFERSGHLPSARAGEEAIARDFGRQLLAKTPTFADVPDQPPGIDLFAPIEGAARLDDAYVLLRDGFDHAAAKAMLQEITRWFPDLDGHFVREAQTTGFSARIWELYLWAAFRALDFDIGYGSPVPDFALTKGGQRLFVEATTVSGKEPFTTSIGPGAPKEPTGPIFTYLEHEMAQKFGSPLFSKLKKRDWEKPHVAGHPFLLALADFHAPGSMRWSAGALPQYLYGLKSVLTPDADNRLMEMFIPGEDHVVGDKRVPTNFFAQPGAENVSGVLFSNAGTLAKFNRMGVRAGFGDAWVSLVREGVLVDPQVFGSEERFKFDVESPAYQEDWWDEMILFHNPNALHPVDPALFPGIGQVRIADGKYLEGGPMRVLWSDTTIFDFLSRKNGRPSWAVDPSDGEAPA